MRVCKVTLIDIRSISLVMKETVRHRDIFINKFLYLHYIILYRVNMRLQNFRNIRQIFGKYYHRHTDAKKCICTTCVNVTPDT